MEDEEITTTHQLGALSKLLADAKTGDDGESTHAKLQAMFSEALNAATGTPTPTPTPTLTPPPRLQHRVP